VVRPKVMSRRTCTCSGRQVETICLQPARHLRNIDFIGTGLTLLNWKASGTMADGHEADAPICAAGSCLFIRFSRVGRVANTIVPVPPPVPERATWAVTLASLGLIAALRGHRDAAAPRR